MSSLSHPARGAWIETENTVSRSSLGESRTPPGVRGLKLAAITGTFPVQMSHPARGAWIETRCETLCFRC